MASPSPPPPTVGSFLHSVGINSAVSYPGTSYYNNIPKVISALSYIGLDTLRDYAPNPRSRTHWHNCGALAALGIKFDFLVHGNGPVDITTELSNLDAFARAYPGSIIAIEGPNEINAWRITYRGITNSFAAGAQVTKDLWTAVKQIPRLAKVPVYALTLSDGIDTISEDEKGLGNLSGYVSYGNAHVYGSGGNNVWTYDMPVWLPVQRLSTAGLPTVVTETGYATATRPGTDAVDEIVAAKYNLNTIFDNALNGIVRTYYFELADSLSSPQSYGFYNADWTPKAAAVALHNLTAILGRGGAGAAPHSLEYTITGLPATAHSLLLGSASGFVISVWNDVTIWDKAGGHQIAAPAQTVTLNFAGTVARASLFDPLLNTSAIATYADTSSVTLSLTDHPLIIRVDAGPAQSPDHQRH